MKIYGPYKRFFVKDLQERKQKYDSEVAQFGRFFLMEGFFNKSDKDLWIEAIEALSYINELVREDIRDKILNETEEKKNERENGNESALKQNLNNESSHHDNISIIHIMIIFQLSLVKGKIVLRHLFQVRFMLEKEQN